MFRLPPLSPLSPVGGHSQLVVEYRGFYAADSRLLHDSGLPTRLSAASCLACAKATDERCTDICLWDRRREEKQEFTSEEEALIGLVRY
jgi:hypothetical protein